MTWVSRSLTERDLELLSIGAAILGTGGGGNPYIGMLRARELLRAGKEIRVIGLDELADDDQVVCVSSIGAPVIGIEKFKTGEECYRALRAVEKATNTPATAIVSAEIGGVNSIEPMVTAAHANLPVVDADGMGRAFPEVQMCTYYIYGHAPAPAALADEKGNEVVLQGVRDMYWLEKLARTVAVDFGASAGFAEAPMTGAFLKTYAVPATVSQALSLGDAVVQARKRRRDPVEAVLERERGTRLFHGKIVDVRRELKGGFAVGRVQLEGFDGWRGQSAAIDIQNENLIFTCDGEVQAVVPDLIIVLDAESGEPITTEVLRYGQRVAVIALPCHPLMRTERALEVVGPAAFGYDNVEYRPLDVSPLPDERSLDATL